MERGGAWSVIGKYAVKGGNSDKLKKEGSMVHSAGAAPNGKEIPILAKKDQCQEGDARRWKPKVPGKVGRMVAIIQNGREKNGPKKGGQNHCLFITILKSEKQKGRFPGTREVK